MALPRVEAFDPVLEQRIASSLVLAAVAIVAVLVGGWLFTGVVLLAIVIMAGEWVRLIPEATPRARRWCWLAIVTLCATAVLAMELGRGDIALAALLLGPFVAAAVAALQGAVPPDRAAGGMVYVGVPTLALVWLRNDLVGGIDHMLWFLAVIWSTDICAYFAGRTIGGPRLAPRISPGKTWAGLIGGVAGAALIGGGAAAWSGAGLWLPACLAVLLALVAQGGDLFESFLKRRIGLKDSGHLIPGHGGLLDRVDGLLFAAPVCALALWLHPAVAGG